MKRVSRQNLILVVPRIRVVDGIRVDVPAVAGVPIRVHGPVVCILSAITLPLE